MNKLEKFLNKIYKPQIKPWKRKRLFWISLIIFLISIFAVYIQYSYQYFNNEIYSLCALFGFISSSGLLVSKFGSDFWVAIIYGDRSFTL
jgi:hypothetical protein